MRLPRDISATEFIKFKKSKQEIADEIFGK